MRSCLAAAACVTALAAAPAVTLAAPPTQTIDLRTREGVAAVKGQWRYADVKLVEVDYRAVDGKTRKTYNIEPKAFGPLFDDSKWEACDPTTLKSGRGGGQVCFSWYRIKITIPESARGRSVFFETTVDDYGEVWVDGKLPRREGDSGGPVVAGFNRPNRLELKGATPGRVYQVAIFAINGPISAEPGNRIFLREAVLQVVGP